MPLYWFCYRHNNQISVVIEPGASIIHARMRGRPRTLHRAEDIGSALKGSVNVCQRQLVSEVRGPLVTEFVRNFGRKRTTPIQRGSNGSLLDRVQAVELIRHNVLQHPYMTGAIVVEAATGSSAAQ